MTNCSGAGATWPTPEGIRATVTLRRASRTGRATAAHRKTRPSTPSSSGLPLAQLEDEHGLVSPPTTFSPDCGQSITTRAPDIVDG